MKETANRQTRRESVIRHPLQFVESLLLLLDLPFA